MTQKMLPKNREAASSHKTENLDNDLNIVISYFSVFLTIICTIRCICHYINTYILYNTPKLWKFLGFFIFLLFDTQYMERNPKISFSEEEHKKRGSAAPRENKGHAPPKTLRLIRLYPAGRAFLQIRRIQKPAA